MISFVKKVTDEEEIKLMKENIKRNRELLILTETYLPKQILKNFNENIKFGESINISPKTKNEEFDDFFDVKIIDEDASKTNDLSNSDFDDFFS